MTSDDERVEYLSRGPAAGAGADPELDELRDLLADPALWAEPDPRLEEAVVAAVGAAAEGAPATARPVAPRRSARRPWALVAAAAAVVVVAVGVGFGVSGDDEDAPELELALRSPLPGSEVTATAELTRTDSGWRIDLSAPQLPRLDGDQLYEAWLRDDDGTLIPVGSFNEGRDVVLWAGVSPLDYPTLTVTREDVHGPAESSGDQVLVGRLDTG